MYFTSLLPTAVLAILTTTSGESLVRITSLSLVHAAINTALLTALFIWILYVWRALACSHLHRRSFALPPIAFTFSSLQAFTHFAIPLTICASSAAHVLFNLWGMNELKSFIDYSLSATSALTSASSQSSVYLADLRSKCVLVRAQLRVASGSINVCSIFCLFVLPHF